MTTHCKPHLLVVNLTISLLLLTISGLAMPSADATVVSSGDAEGNMAQVDEIQAELESAPEEIDLELKAKPSQLPISQQVQKAVRLAEGGRPADALKVLSNIPNDDPNLAYTYHKIGNAFYDLGMLKDAFAAYDAATWSNKSYYYSWYNKGNTLSDLGDQENYNSSRYRDAVSMYDVALNISSSYYLAAYNKGNQLFKLQNYTEAIDAYDNAIKENRNYHFAWYNRGNAFFEIGYQLGDDRNAYNKAILSYKRALEAEPKYYFALNNLAHVLSRVGQDREALKAYTDALIIRPNFTVAYNNLGFLLRDQGQYPEAITEFNRIIKNLTWNNQNMSSSSDLLARAYFGKGTSESRLGMYDNATQDFDKAADILPSYFQAMHYKGVLLNDLGRYDEAKTSYDDAITVLEDKFNASAPIYLGKIHNDKAIALDNVGDYFGALSEIDEAIAAYPDGTSEEANAIANKDRITIHMQYLVVGIVAAIILGPLAWILAKRYFRNTTKFLYNIQRISILHFIPSLSRIDNDSYFLLAKADESQKKRFLALLFVAIASYALLTTATGRTIESLEAIGKELGLNQGASDQSMKKWVDDEVTVQELVKDDSGLPTVVILGNEPKPIMNEVNDRLIIFRVLIWGLTIFLLPLFILPIEVMESAGIRLRLDQKMVVVSPTSPFKLLLGGFTVIGAAAAVLYEITSGMLLQYSYILFLTFMPLVPMILLYLAKSEKSASAEFREYLSREKGIRAIEQDRFKETVGEGSNQRG